MDVEKLLNTASTMWSNNWPKLAAAAAILVFGWIAARIIRGVLQRALTVARMDAGLISFLTSLAHILLMAIVVISALGKLGVETTSFAAVIAAGGLAVGLALQGSLSNFASGVMILFFRPFKVGDYVEAAGTAGIVQEVAIFASTLTTPDNKKIVVPNSAITGGNITNYSAMETRRIDLVFGVGYDDDLKKAKALLTKIVNEHSKVLDDPAPVVALSELADSSVNFVVRPWVKTADYWDVYFELMETAKLALDDAGISIPFPQRDVHVHQHQVGEKAA